MSNMLQGSLQNYNLYIICNTLSAIFLYISLSLYICQYFIIVLKHPLSCFCLCQWSRHVHIMQTQSPNFTLEKSNRGKFQEETG